jgi:hypothetical protein
VFTDLSLSAISPNSPRLSRKLRISKRPECTAHLLSTGTKTVGEAERSLNRGLWARGAETIRRGRLSNGEVAALQM